MVSTALFQRSALADDHQATFRAPLLGSINTGLVQKLRNQVAIYEKAGHMARLLEVILHFNYSELDKARRIPKSRAS